ncbi:MAG: urease accessory protein UreD [Pseudomonadota bacterium]
MADAPAAGRHDVPARDRWDAWLALAYEGDGRRTVLRRLGARGPLYVQRPFYPEGARCHTYLLHPPGGIAGHDTLDISVCVREHAGALLTTPAAGKCYRSAGSEARVLQRLEVAAGGALEWLPQENLIFNGARAHFDLRIDLDPEARLLALDGFGLGRPHSGETFEHGRLRQRVAVDLRSIAGPQPLLRERFELTGGDRALAAPWGLKGAAAFGALYAYPAEPELLRWLRARLNDSIWQQQAPVVLTATLIDGLLVVRAMATELEAQTLALRAAWSLLREPILGASPNPPRIWNT